MTVLNIEQERLVPFLAGCDRLGLRYPELGNTPSDPTRVLTWTPDLTPEETLLAQMAAGAVSLTPAEWSAIRDDIVVIRDLRQMGRAAFMALTAAERDRLMYDAQAATTTILLAILRD
jgi:hypothetical protein